MTDLPLRARIYVVAVILAGGVAFGASLPPPLAKPGLFALLLGMSVVAAAFKIRLPVYTGGSTLSISYAFDFTAILLLSPAEAMVVAGASAWAQCTVNRAEHYPMYRTVFSMASVMLATFGASLAFRALGGHETLALAVPMLGPVLVAGTVFFVINSGLIAVALTFSTGDSLRRVWYQNLFWSAPGYLVGAVASALVALLVLAYGDLVLLAVFLPAYLSYRAYDAYNERIVIEQQHVKKISELHEQAMEALALVRRSEQALAAEKERLAVTLGSIADGVITAGTSGRVMLMNRVAEQITGWTQEAAMGQALAAVFPAVHRETGAPVEPILDQVLRSDGTVQRNTTAALVVAGERRLVEWSATPMHDRDDVIGVVLVLRDITAAVRLEEEREKASKLESLGTLAGGIAHDFNNIMTAIVGNLSLVSMGAELDPHTARRLMEAERACHRAKSLTQQLLTFSKGGAPVKSVVTLPTILEDAATFALRGSNVRCECTIDERLWPVEADTGQLTQAINNIVLNAKQAMPAGGVVQLSATNATLAVGDAPGHLTEGDYVRILISDRGTGIPAHLLPKVFDPYFTTKRQASGLGLATSYSIVRNHGGRISIDSKVGVGTTVEILLPRTTRQPRAVAPPPREARAVTRARVLVMDDEDAVRELLGEMLSCLGYDATLTCDGDQAITAAARALGEQKPFDAAIMDLTIPGGMGGKEAILKLRQIQPTVRAIVSSGYADDPVMADFESYGFDGVVTKPYTIKDLGRALETLLAERAA
ncbi:MAG: ATP-binding protein [Acidobacteriota bacterium]